MTYQFYDSTTNFGQVYQIFSTSTKGSLISTGVFDNTTDWITWTKPKNAKLIQICGIGAGGAGGAGGFNATASVYGGGGGGSAGGATKLLIPAYMLPDKLYIKLGYGGKSGVTSAGGNTIISIYPDNINTFSYSNYLIFSKGGGDGAPGGTVAGGGGGSGGAYNSYQSPLTCLGLTSNFYSVRAGITGQQYTGFSNVTNYTQGATAGTASFLGLPGAAGGATTNATSYAGGTPSFGGTGGVANGGDGRDGRFAKYDFNNIKYQSEFQVNITTGLSFTILQGSTAGGGGGGNINAKGGDGGEGGYGSGGGGGGASTGASGSAGLGGDGGGGLVMIISHT